jgi:glycyl-tRNA synthetase beta chain
MSIARKDFLVEIGTEELPPKSLPDLEQAFTAGVRAGLEQAALPFRALTSYATPRRLAVWVRGLAVQQPEQEVKRKGPPVSAAFGADGTPTRAAQAFADSCGIALDALTRVQEAKGEFLFYSGSKPGQATAALLPVIVQSALNALPIPKRMRWGAGEAQFVRPVHWVVLLFGRELVPASILDLPAGLQTRGHRFHANKTLTLGSPAGYAKQLLANFVVASFPARRAQILAGVHDAASKLVDAKGGAARAIVSDALLDEVTALVEWPVPVVGRFEERFLTLPREVLISTLQEHQRYFPVEDAGGQLLPYFITISNIESTNPAAVIAGNERVVRPRLTDAAFFWEQDRKQKLGARLVGLDSVTYQAKLGSIGAKVARVENLAALVGAGIGADATLTQRAAELCKCDLLSAMVGEFPDLQGIMGRHYALADGEPREVADAIREHYLPRGAGDELPSSRTGMALSIADKLDTIAGIFALGQKPTGAKDPFGVRRAAIGLLRVMVEKQLPLNLRELISAAVSAQPAALLAATSGGGAPTAGGTVAPDRAAAISAEVYAYIMERLRAQYVEGTSVAGVTTEMFEAVLATEPASPLDFDARLRALVQFLARPEAASLAAANKRIANILKKSESSAIQPVQAALLKVDEEKALQAFVEALRPGVENSLARGDYADAFNALAGLRDLVDAFFDKVLVNDPDTALRANRLSLLAGLRGLFTRIADLSRLPG